MGLTVLRRRTPYPGGAPANVAAALGKLGAKVGFITAFGNDDLAKQMQQLLEGEVCKSGRFRGDY